VIRTNLSSRPFYNERLVYMWLAVAGRVVVVATAFNASRVLRYSRSDTQLETQASRDESRAADLRRQAAQLRASVDPAAGRFRRGRCPAGQRPDRPADVFVDRAVQPFRNDAADDVRIASVGRAWTTIAEFSSTSACWRRQSTTSTPSS
jgi:hypothetical protein